MPFIPVANTAKVAIKYLLYGQEVINTMWFNKGDDWSGEDLNTLAIAVASWVTDELMPLRTVDMTFTGIEARDMSAEGAEGVDLAITPAVAGGTSVAGLPSGVALSIKFLTGLTGRSNRGRNYLAGLFETEVTGNTVLNTTRDAYIAAFEALASYLTGLTADHVVASLYSGVDTEGHPIPRSAGVVHAVTSYALDTFVDSMRRRLTGRGS